MPTLFDVCGTDALWRVESVLREHGYRPTDGRPREPGEYRTDRSDAAPGWSDWMYEVEVVELPEPPLAALLARIVETRP